MAKQLLKRDHHHLDFVIRHSPAAPKPSQGGSLQSSLIATDARLTELVKNIDTADRVAVDTEADSLHSYREKLCLIQISVPVVGGIVDAGRERHSFEMSRDHQSGLQQDLIVDPLSDLDLQPLRRVLESREIVLHGSDYDLRMLRRGLNFISTRIFD